MYIIYIYIVYRHYNIVIDGVLIAKAVHVMLETLANVFFSSSRK